MIYQMVKAGDITGIDHPSQGVGLDIKPYGIAGFTRDIERRNIMQPSGKIGEEPLSAAHSAGADIFYRITSNLVSSTTINTDFAETEVDTRNLGLQSRLRWTVKPGNGLFLVINHAWQYNTFDRFEALQSNVRAKLSYMFWF